MKVKNDMKKV